MKNTKGTFDHHHKNGEAVVLPLTDRPRIDRIASSPVRTERKGDLGPGTTVQVLPGPLTTFVSGGKHPTYTKTQGGFLGQVWAQGDSSMLGRNVKAWWVVTPAQVAYLIPESELLVLGQCDDEAFDLETLPA